jgi:hypothetical protein
MTAPGKPYVRTGLPPRGVAEEDAFVWGLLDAAPPEAVADLVGEALEAGRPQLAARLVGLLPDDLQDPDLDRARAAARFVVQSADADSSELDSAWRRLCERRLIWRSRLSSDRWGARNPLDPFPPTRRRR